MKSSPEERSLRNRQLAEKLLAMTRESAPATTAPRPAADAIVAHIEINDHHGVGVLIQRLFGEYDNLVSIRSKDFYEGRQAFGKNHVCISHGDASRDRVFWNVLDALGGITVGRILCVPYFPDDALTAIALKEAYGAPLCTFLMDDQNLCSDGIPDSIMAELLSKSSLRLAISQEMRTGYERKYRCKLWFMPPLAPTRLIPLQLNQPPMPISSRRSAVILGNIWGERWIEMLRKTVRGSGITLQWYNNGEFRWLPCSQEALMSDGIAPQQGIAPSDDELVAILRRAPFVVLPSGTLDESDNRRFIAQMSFPSRIPYIFATSHTPILVMGSPETAAARLVTRLGIGMVVPYEREAFAEAVLRMTDPDANLRMRRAAFLLANRFADVGAAEWLWQSLANGAPCDRRYEDLLPPQEA